MRKVRKWIIDQLGYMWFLYTEDWTLSVVYLLAGIGAFTVVRFLWRLTTFWFG